VTAAPLDRRDDLRAHLAERGQLFLGQLIEYQLKDGRGVGGGGRLDGGPARRGQRDVGAAPVLGRAAFP
jgi:hypothetical protein